MVYRSPQVPGGPKDEDTSFGEWKQDDPLPLFQDHVTGFPLVSPPDETAHTSPEKPKDWPRKQPCHPAFGPPSVVKVPVPWKDRGESSRVSKDQTDDRQDADDGDDTSEVGRRQRRLEKKVPLTPSKYPSEDL